MCYGPGADEPKAVSMGLLSKKRGTAAMIRNAFIACERAYLLPPATVTEAQVRCIHLLILRNLARELEVAAATAPEAFKCRAHVVFAGIRVGDDGRHDAPIRTRIDATWVLSIPARRRCGRRALKRIRSSNVSFSAVIA